MAERKQKRTRQRRGFLDFVNALLTLIVIALLVCGGLFLYGVHSFYAPGPIKADTDFVVEKGANLSSVAEQLAAKGLIDNSYVFEAGGLLSRKHKALKAGEFKLSANASMAQILGELTEGKAVQHGITVPEGFTMAQVVDRLNSDTELTGTLTNIPPEGGVLPQTYNFEPGVSRQSVLNQMVAAQQKALDDIWAHRAPNLPLASPQQLVTLASIVEKETGVPEERAHVAAVFINRLEKHMRLQSDPTIIYGVTLGKAPLGRPLKRSEIEAVTPYNTYQVNGLPPTPIDNPGIDSLKAAANPADSNDLYFVAVSTNPADGHLFAASYTEQQHNVAKLRAAQKLAAADAEAADAEDELEAQQAAAAGDATAADTPPSQPASPPASAAAPATPAASPAPPGSAPATPGPAVATPAEATAPAASPSSADDTGAPAADTTEEAPPMPMPANARPTPAGNDSTAPAPERPEPVHPTHSQAQPQDAFGG